MQPNPIFYKSFHFVFGVTIICTIASTQTFAQPRHSQIHPKAQGLIDHVQSIRDKPISHHDWSPLKGPWANYIRTSYVDQLNHHEKVLYNKALNEINCAAIENLQTRAFLRTYPYLGAAHERKSVADAFRETVIVSLPDYFYCRRQHNLERILRLIKTEKLAILPFDLSLQSYRSDAIDGKLNTKEPGLRDRARNSLCANVSWLVHEAIDRDNKRAIEDALRLSRHSRTFKFTKAQLYYLLLRARQLNIFPNDGQNQLDDVYHGVKAATRINIETYLKAPEKTQNKPYLRHRICGFPRLSIHELAERP